MINYNIKYTKEFKKSLKKVLKQGKKIDKLLKVVNILSKVKHWIINIKTIHCIMIKDLKIVEIVILNLIGY